MVFWRRKKRLPPVVSCYGKLPAAGDFVRTNATEPIVAAFDEWLGRAIHLAKEQMGSEFDACYRSALGVFIFTGSDADGAEEPERGMIGVWAASGDAAGRRYPMVIATSYDYEEMLAVGAGLPIAVWPFLAAAYDLVANGRGLGPEEFVARVQQLQPIPLDDPESATAPYQRWLRGQTMRALWETGFGTADCRYGVLHSVNASVEIFRGQERPQTNLAIRFPIRAGDAYAVAVWIDMTMRLARWRRTVPNAFWTPQHDLMLHIGSPHPSTFRELIANGTNAEHVTDLLMPPSLDQATARIRLGKLAEVLEDDGASISQFLSRLGGSEGAQDV